MKKTRKVFSLVLCAVIIASFCACSTNDPSTSLPVPAYPLTAEYMQEYVDELEKGHFVKDNSFPNDYDDFESIALAFAPVDAPQFENVGMVSTAYKGERSLSFTFAAATPINSGLVPGYSSSDTGKLYDMESLEEVVRFATKLFGGFSDEDAVYKVLKKELGKKNTTEGEADPDNGSKVITWKTQIDDISCEIRFIKPYEDKDEMYLRMILFMTDPELYEQRNQQRIKDLNIKVD